MIRLAPAAQPLAKVENQPLTMVSGQNDRMAGSVPVWNGGASFAENLADANAEKTDGFGIGDIIDIINPLQHIPLVSNLYQSATGDTMGSIAQIVGGALFGGPVGAVISAGMVAFHAATDTDTSPQPLADLSGTTIALADMRTGYTPYNS